MSDRNIFTCFNSTMVRLKENMALQIGECPAWFQFHYGSIKGVSVSIVARVAIVSIPLWFD